MAVRDTWLAQMAFSNARHPYAAHLAEEPGLLDIIVVVVAELGVIAATPGTWLNGVWPRKLVLAILRCGLCRGSCLLCLLPCIGEWVMLMKREAAICTQDSSWTRLRRQDCGEGLQHLLACLVRI